MFPRGFCALGVALALLVACTEQPSARTPSSSAQARELRVRWVGDRESDAPLVVLLHGYGAAGDDLVFLAEELHRRLAGRARFALPEAPLRGPANGRAWWPMARRDLPIDEAPPGLADARRDVIAWLENERPAGRIDPARTIVAGFSQGAMLAADVAIEWDRQLAGAIILSGGPIAMERWGARMRERRPPPILITHGEQDPVLAFSGAVRLREHIEQAGGTVRFLSFQGRHGIPPVAVATMEDFIRTRLDLAQ